MTKYVPISSAALLFALIFSTAAMAEEAAPAAPIPKTYVFTEAQAADYARRLQIEMQQITEQYKADLATLSALQTQAAPSKDVAKESAPPK